MKTRLLSVPPRSLKYIDKWLFWRAILLAIMLRLLLRLMPFKTVIKLLKMFEQNDVSKTQIKIEDDELKTYRLMISLSYKLWPFINCLSTSLAFWFILRKKGICTELQFGVLKDGNKLRSHAWLEYDNNILSPDDRAIQKYKSFAQAIL